MLFNSFEFIFLFLPVTFFVYFYLAHKKLTIAAKGFLAAASLFFYSYWNIIYLPLILGSIAVNYIIGTRILGLVGSNLDLATHRNGGGQSSDLAAAQTNASQGANLQTLNQAISNLNDTSNLNPLSPKSPTARKAKAYLISGILFNVLLLGYFKYTDFFIANFNGLFGADVPLSHIVLPIGISFFTFTQIAFLVDAHAGKVRDLSPLNYILFVTYFPHLLAGPILHHSEMMPQFASRWNMAKNYNHIAMGLFLFSMGLFKKVIIADQFAVWANAGFAASADLNLIEAWITSLSYTMQLYFDFSGYTDMAIGISLMFNIKLPINFNSPYKATSVQDFWRRWHITLSRFLRDYVYIPLGGNRRGKVRLYSNLMITFLVGGFWHGAGWTFVFWGFLHGAALIVHRVWTQAGFVMNKYLAWFITFNFINVTWVFFRAENINQAVEVLKGMIGVHGVAIPAKIERYFSFLGSFITPSGAWLDNIRASGATEVFSILFVGLLITLFAKNSNELTAKFKFEYKALIFSLVMTLWAISSFNKTSEFLYFNF